MTNSNASAATFFLRSQSEIDEGRVEFHWGAMWWFGSHELGNTTGVTMGLMTMKPAATNDRHFHPNCEEVLYLQQGLLEHRVGEEVIRQQPGEFLTIPANTPHSSTNIGEGEAKLIIAFSSAAREFIPC